MIVVKTGGKILEEGLPQNVALDIKQVASTNRFIFIHGGGIEVTNIATKLGKPQKFIVSPEGFKSRYTDRETAEIYTMVMAGKINKQAVTILQQNSVPAIGLSGLDGLLVRAKRKKRLVIINERGRKMVIDGGYTGTITEINSTLLNLLLDNGYVPVISPIAISEEFESLNVDGDRFAAYIAGSLKADILILLTDVEGLIINGKVIPRLSAFEAKEVLKKIGQGMSTKVHAAIETLDMGTKEVIISSGMVQNPISSAIEHRSGTVIYYE
ncbi:[LysW]-aminoadipate/[LysW]-glutamate kinase [Candidatus Bathyarchaeota archaeon]|nr:[LysW]-aminoadipate/[LysW]-glutamate kinase [Candidatus Bathyarchaeota archaeon]